MIDHDELEAYLDARRELETHLGRASDAVASARELCPKSIPDKLVEIEAAIDRALGLLADARTPPFHAYCDGWHWPWEGCL